MKIFITGGTGFVGSHLVQKLIKEGHNILLLCENEKKISRKIHSVSRVRFLLGNMANISKFSIKIKKFNSDVGIHLAWEGIPNSDLKLNLKNLNGGLNVIQTLAESGVKRIFVAGSCHEYGEPGKKVSENLPLNPYNALYAAKAALYFLSSEICKKYGVKLIWGRIGFVYGPGQRGTSLISHLINSIQKNEEPVLRNPNGGNDFIYINDVVRAISMLIKGKNLGVNEIYNIGSGKLGGVMKITENIYDAFKLPLPKGMKRVKKPIGFFMDISKIKKDIGWQPQITIEKGIKKTVAFYSNIKKV